MPARGYAWRRVRVVGLLVGFRGHESSKSVAVADVIGDGWYDVLIGHHVSRPVGLFLNQPAGDTSSGFEPVLRLFDELVLSFRVGARKPDVRFFEACIRASGRAADQIIYIDDRPDYVAAARALGVQAFVYDAALPPPAI